MKAIFYSATVALFVIPLLLLSAVYLESMKSVSEEYTQKSVNDKLLSIAKSIDNDLPRAARIIGRRSLEANIQYIEINGIPLSDVEASMSEAMINGTVLGNITTLDNFTLTRWASDLNEEFRIYGLDSNISVLSINITQEDSYNVIVGVIISVNITDSTGNTNLYRIYDTRFYISIAGVIDPLYLLETNGVFKRTIVQPSQTVYGVGAVDSATASKWYMESANGPSLLDRMEGRLVNTYGSGTGLETIVNLPDLQANGFTIKTDQVVFDYLYFDGVAHSGQAVNNSAYTWLRFDADHASIYGVELVP